MRNGFLGSIALLCAGVGMTVAQTPPTMPPSSPPSAAPAAAVPAPAPVVTSGTGLRSPYWPTPQGAEAVGINPAAGCGKNGCADGSCAKGDCLDSNLQTPAPQCFWGTAEYIVWWMRDGRLNEPILTVGSVAGQGVLGAPGTAVIGNTDLDYKAASGGRFTLGGWLDPCTQSVGLEGTGFFLERRPAGFGAQSSATGTPVYARPFINAVNGTEDALLVSAPGQLFGGVSVGSSARFYGWDANFVFPWYADGEMKLELLAGVRNMYLSEDLNILQHSILLAGGAGGFVGNPVIPPAQYDIIDRFQTRNEYWGGQLGARGEYRSGRIFANASGKLAFGSMHEVLSIDGVTRLSNAPSVPATANNAVGAQGGLLALASNIGKTARDNFALVPEVNFNIGYNLNSTFSVFCGYTFLYVSEIARPGDQINRTVNPTTVPSSQAFGVPVGPAAPTLRFDGSEFWAQGLNFGLAVRY